MLSRLTFPATARPVCLSAPVQSPKPLLRANPILCGRITPREGEISIRPAWPIGPGLWAASMTSIFCVLTFLQ
jgi:hypothetical protein